MMTRIKSLKPDHNTYDGRSFLTVEAAIADALRDYRERMAAAEVETAGQEVRFDLFTQVDVRENGEVAYLAYLRVA